MYPLYIMFFLRQSWFGCHKHSFNWVQWYSGVRTSGLHELGQARHHTQPLSHKLRKNLALLQYKLKDFAKGMW